MSENQFRPSRRSVLKGASAALALGAGAMPRQASAQIAMEYDGSKFQLAAPEANPKRGGVLRYGITSRPPHFDVHQSGTINSLGSQGCMFDNLVRRDPRDTLLSMYKNKFPDGTHLAAYDQRDLVHLYASFVDMVNFWRERVPDWFYEVEYETLVANPEPETRKLIAASGLEWEDACLSPQDNDRKVETLSLFQVRQPISGGSVKGWKRYEKDRAPMLDELRKLGLVSD